ncbi:hypothetical protein Tco_0685478 [Tanacetum coccineum]
MKKVVLNIASRYYIDENTEKLRVVIETAKYGKIWYDKDIHDLSSIETEFPAITFNKRVSSGETLSCEPTVSSLNDEIDFRISFDDSDDEDYTNEFSAIVYNDALTSKSDFLTEPTLSPQHIDEFDLKDETSLSEYDEIEQNVLYFNDLFPFNVIYPGDLKSDKDNDNNEIDMIQSSRGFYTKTQYVEGLQYTNADIVDFETRLARIYRKEGQSMFTSRAWRRLFDIRGPLVYELILEFFSTFRFGEVVLDLDTETLRHGYPQEGDVGGVVEEAPVGPGGGDVDEEMPQAVPPPPRTQGKRIARLEEEVHGMREVLQGQREVLDSMACDLSKFTMWTVTSLSLAYTRYSESSIKYQRCIRQRIDGTNTSTTPQ